MRINYKETALGFLEHPESIEFGLPPNYNEMTLQESIAFAKSVQDTFKTVAPLFKTKIRYVALSFFEAYEKAKHKLVSVFEKEEFSDSGTLIVRNGSSTNTTFYSFRTFINDGVWGFNLIYYVFNKHTSNPMNNLDVLIVESEKSTKTFIYDNLYKAGATSERFVAFIISFILFLKYVEVETKFVEAGRKVHHAGEKYKNDTNQKVEIIDSLWFTTVIRSAGFMVGDETGGFFRLQPYGKGNSERRLVWIQPYEKHGYTRRAKILTNQ